ncbi:UDP-N-acetyl glucosamine 2-epimerase [bacterium]|nr:UDP-N-acetyl glucosamine 2-epimerase [bacterium]
MPVERSLREQSVLQPLLIHTGQHYDYNMSRIFFEEMGIPEPDYHLGVGSGSHAYQTAEGLIRIEEVLLKERPDAVVVFGDTNATLSGSMAAVKLHLPVVHVEAGLRSFNRDMPEEINRILTDHASTVLFCPCKRAAARLGSEGLPPAVRNGDLVTADDLSGLPARARFEDRIVINTGDVMYDVMKHSLALAEQRSAVLERMQLIPGSYGLLTMHRAENTGDPERLTAMAAFINRATAGGTVVFPMHPRTKNSADGGRFGLHAGVRIIEPQGYFDLLMLLHHSRFLLTDSGGMQKEAYWAGVPCVTLRKETEWTETVESGWNRLFRDFDGTFPEGENERDAYGRGTAAHGITAVLSALLG